MYHSIWAAFVPRHWSAIRVPDWAFCSRLAYCRRAAGRGRWRCGGYSGIGQWAGLAGGGVPGGRPGDARAGCPGGDPGPRARQRGDGDSG